MNKKQILVVDDDTSILEVIKLILEDQGYEVITSDNGDILIMVEENRPDLILLDVLLSGKDGREIARTLKQNEKTKSIPILMVSAHPTGEMTAVDSGADGFLPKPFNIDELLKLVFTFTRKVV